MSSPALAPYVEDPLQVFTENFELSNSPDLDPIPSVPISRPFGDSEVVRLVPQMSHFFRSLQSYWLPRQRQDPCLPFPTGGTRC